MKKILLISAGHEAVPGIVFAKKSNLKTIVVDQNKNAPGFQYADYKIYSSTYNYIDIINNLEKKKLAKKIDGILSLSADVPVTIAQLGLYLNINTISLKTAKICSDKIKMKNFLKKNNVNVPWYSGVEDYKFLKNLTNNFDKLVLKPVDSRGARGVLLIDKNTDLNWAYRYSLSFSPKKKLIVEEFLEGTQISTESIVYDNSVYTPCFVERNYRDIKKFLPHIIENGGQQPSRLSNDKIKKIIDLKKKATLALGIKNSTSKGDMILSGNNAYVIEIAPRLSGGWLSTHQTYLGTGVNFLKTAFKLSLNQPLTKKDFEVKRNKAVVIRYFFSKPGKILKIPNLKEIKKNKNVKLIKFFYKKNQIIPIIKDHTNRLGFVIISCDLKKEALKLANQVVIRIQQKIIIDG